MFASRPLLRRCLLATSCLGLLLPVTAQAQNAAIPTRVGQIASLSGSVSYNGAGSGGQWVAATPNYPVTNGDSLFTQAGAEAAIILNASRLTLGANTEVQITALDDTHFSATESQGEVFLSLSDLQAGQIFTLETPRGTVTISQAGAYDITAGDAQTPTTVAVLEGAASVGQLQIPAGQEGVLSGTDQTTAQLAPLQRDAFEDHVMAEMMPPPPPYAAAPVQQMTGVDELSTYGSWSQSPDYGAIWYPYVTPGWAPFREGHWAYIAPWGWTWVDGEPWGFAPFHYGRWIDSDGRWGWVPGAAYSPGYAYGPDDQPVYTPAVVGFFGLAAGAALTASLLASQSVGWVPLAPGEPFYPAYHADPAYLRRINRGDVRNFDPAAHREVAPGDFANRRAATYIPADAMARGSSVAYFGRPMTPALFGHAHALGGFNQALHPQITHQPAAAPHPSAFATQHSTPPMITHGAAPAIHPTMARPAPNGGEFHPGPETRPQNFGSHPPAAPVVEPHAAPPRPSAETFHQPMPHVYQPHEAPPRPQVQTYHPPMQTYRPPAQAYHPPMPAYRPPAPQFHQPAPQPHAAPRPQPHQDTRDDQHHP
ncbi:DUF6600 domain-containing protein [Acidocella sp.]|uniref:DUF6600 domain-containing protein n=1 Tax=Acidocella sp. TaxID=50710 RepID=UPI002F4165BE